MTAPHIPARHRSARRTRRAVKARGFKILLLLTGMLLALNILREPVRFSGSPEHPGFELVHLHSGPELVVLRDVEFPREWMFSSPLCEKVTENRHLWLYLQQVQVGHTTGSVYYFEFRTEPEALAAAKWIHTNTTLIGSKVARAYGYFAVLVHTGGTNEKLDLLAGEVFAQIESNLSGRGGGQAVVDTLSTQDREIDCNLTDSGGRQGEGIF